MRTGEKELLRCWLKKRSSGFRKLTLFEKFFLSKRGIVETVIDQLKAIRQIEHTRHRSPFNFMSNLLAALAAYVLRPRKPSLKFDLNNNSSLVLMSN
jgi:hypothetical protein